jgi:hypothetical protein
MRTVTLCVLLSTAGRLTATVAAVTLAQAGGV